MGKAVNQRETHDRIVALSHAGDHRAVPLAMEEFARNPNASSIGLLALAARSRGLVLPSRHHPDHLAVRFTYSLESAIADVLEALPPAERHDCLAAIGRNNPSYCYPRDQGAL